VAKDLLFEFTTTPFFHSFALFATPFQNGAKSELVSYSKKEFDTHSACGGVIHFKLALRKKIQIKLINST